MDNPGRLAGALVLWSRLVEPIVRRTPMKTRCTLTLGAVAVLGLAATVNGLADSADSQSPIVGTWQVTSISAQALNTKQSFRPFGDQPTGYLQYSPGGHVIVFMTAGGPLRPAPPHPPRAPPPTTFPATT